MLGGHGVEGAEEPEGGAKKGREPARSLQTHPSHMIVMDFYSNPLEFHEAKLGSRQVC